MPGDFKTMLQSPGFALSRARWPRHVSLHRYLRKIYQDPVGGKSVWGLHKVGGLITGVHSLSPKEPIKKFEFHVADQSFKGTGRSSDWVFTPRTGNRPVVALPGGSGLPGLPISSRPGALPNGVSR